MSRLKDRNFPAYLKALLHSSQTCWIAYSGGLDSHVLLHLFANVLEKNNIPLKVVHVNHDLNPKADQWQEHCQKICDALNLPLHSIKIQIQPNADESPEALARDGRYAAFASLMQAGDYCVTAHHLNDQAETVLLQLLRGAGPQGLASMPDVKPFGPGFLMRPFLSYSRQDLLDYAKENHLHWIEDDSNANTRFDRNFVRHGVLPVLQERWPNAVEVLARVAQNCQDVTAILEEVAVQDLSIDQKDLGNTLFIPMLLSLSEARRNNVIRFWCKSQGYTYPSRQQLEELHQTVLLASADAEPHLFWENVEIRRFRDHLYVMAPLSHVEPIDPIQWSLSENTNHMSLKLPFDLGTLQAKKVKGQGIRFPDNAKITIRFRQGGERCRLPNRAGTHDLKKLWQEWNVPTWQRSRVPLIYCDDTLASVVGYCICEPFVAHSEEGWIIEVL